MQGIDEDVRRELGVNLTGGRTNATEILQKVMHAPKLDELVAGFLDEKKSGQLG